MDKCIYCLVYFIALCLLASCSFNNKKLGYEQEDKECEYHLNDTEEEWNTPVVVDEFNEYDTVIAVEKDNVVANRRYNKNDKLLPMVYSDSKFSIRFPSTWEIVQQNARATAHTTIAVQIMQIAENDYAFRPNVNVIVSQNKHTESTASLARLTYDQAKAVGFATSLVGIREYSINGKQGSVAEYIASIEGYKLHIFQYIVKNKDNSTFTITMTLDHDNMAGQKTLAQQIIDSIKIF